VFNLSLTNLVDAPSIVKLFDCEIGEELAQIHKKDGHSSLKRKHRVKFAVNRVAPDASAEAKEELKKDFEAILSPKSGDSEHSALAYWLQPNETLHLTFPQGVCFQHGLAVSASPHEGMEPDAKSVHIQLVYVH
jgi:hypothetical protein